MRFWLSSRQTGPYQTTMEKILAKHTEPARTKFATQNEYHYGLAQRLGDSRRSMA